jgi:hypothetical protein
MKNYPREFWKFTIENKVNFFVVSVFVFGPTIGLIVALYSGYEDYITLIPTWIFFAGLAYALLINNFIEAKKKNKSLNLIEYFKNEFVSFIVILGLFALVTWALLI